MTQKSRYRSIKKELRDRGMKPMPRQIRQETTTAPQSELMRQESIRRHHRRNALNDAITAVRRILDDEVNTAVFWTRASVGGARQEQTGSTVCLD